MPQVKLEDVAVESRETYKGDKTGMPIVGLEHITPGEVTLSNWDTDTDNTFTKRFCKGDMLFGRRRAYLKKAAQAPFDGICSGDITVIRAKEDLLLPELLPFIIQNDNLFDFAVGKSAGSLSPRVKWDNLKNYTFELPTMDEQKKLAEVLWSINNTLQAYQNLLTQTDALVQAQFIEMFGDPNIPMHNLSEYILFLTSGSRGWARYYCDEGEYFITIKNVKNGKISLDNMQCINPPQNAEAERTKVQEGDLLISVTADLGRTGVVSKEIAKHGAYINQHLTCVRLNKDLVHPLFASYFLESPFGKDQFDRMNNNGVKAGLNFNSIGNLKIIVPPIEQQNLFVSFIQRTFQAKTALQNTIASLQATKRCILETALGNRGKE